MSIHLLYDLKRTETVAYLDVKSILEALKESDRLVPSTGVADKSA